MDKLKEFWTELKADYENKYEIPFLTDYDKSVPYFEKMEELLLDMQKEDEKNVEIACLLVSVRMELRESYCLIFWGKMRKTYLITKRQDYIQISDIIQILRP